jgi:hypothetical protein
MTMKKLEYFSLIRQLNEEFYFIFDDVLYHDTSICLILTGGDGAGKVFTLKLTIQGLLRLYNRNMSFDLKKFKVLLMPSIG